MNIKPVDPEIENIKSQLQAIGIMLVAAVVVLPFNLPGWFNFPVIAMSPVTYLLIQQKIKKFKESKSEEKQP